MVNKLRESNSLRESTAVLQVIASGRLWRGNGPAWGGSLSSAGSNASDRLEDAFAERIGLPYVHAVNSGTSANEAALASLGLNAGDEVICPAASPAFVPLAVLSVGCIPVFADVDPNTLLLDPNRIKDAINDRTRALVVVHLWGMPAPMNEIMKIAEDANLKVIEDCAQAFATMIDGQRVGTFGHASCFSLQQSKHITSGEGGLFATRSVEAYSRAVLYSNSGIPSYRFGVTIPKTKIDPVARGHHRFGHNHRIGELQAAVALAQLQRIDEFTKRRAELVEVICEHVKGANLEAVRLPQTSTHCSVSYWRFPVLVPSLRGTYKGIPYLEPVFQEIADRRITPFGAPIPKHVDYRRGSCPGAEAGAAQIRSISVHHSLTDEELYEALGTSLADLQHDET